MASQSDAAQDIWWDDDGCWVQIGPQTFGPFKTEQEAKDYRTTRINLAPDRVTFT